MDFLSHTSIFQSPLFAEFQQKIPYREKTFQIQVGDLGNRISATIVRVQLNRWCWLWVPYGPVVEKRGVALEKGPTQKCAVDFIDALKTIARQERAVFTRIEPGAHTPPELVEALTQAVLTRTAPTRFTPDHTLVLDLSLTDEDLLKQMKPKGRYNIKVAQKNGVLVRKYNSAADISETDFDAWYQIVQETGNRDGFKTHGKAYYSSLIDTLGPKGAATLLVAYNASGDVLGGAIATFYDKVGMYYYGASKYEHRALMAPYLVQWEAIRESRTRGCEYYDFLGVSPPNDKEHAWAGVTDFKEKFGGVRFEYPAAFDVIHSLPLYSLYRLRSWMKR